MKKRTSDKVLFYPSEFGERREKIISRMSFLKRVGVKAAKTRTGGAILALLIKTAPKACLSLAITHGLRFTMAHLLTAHPETVAPYFDQVKRFNLFLAMSRSGHSIIAHLLSAHPRVQISDELAAISLFDEGYSLEQVSALIKLQDYVYIRRRREKSGYDYLVEGVWQNTFDKYPEVIGDAKGARSIKLLGEKNGFLPFLRSTLKMPLRVIVHLRNPFDTISTRSRKREIELHHAVNHFIEREQIMSIAYRNLFEEERLVQRHEDVIAAPRKHFIRMFEFLEVEPIPEVVEACAAKIWKEPNLTRKQIDWPGDEVERVEACLRKSELFHSYSCMP